MAGKGILEPLQSFQQSVVYQPQPGQVLQGPSQVLFVGEEAVLYSQKLILPNREDPLPGKPLPSLRRQIGAWVGKLLLNYRFVQEGGRAGSFQDPVQGRLKKSLHDDLIPVGAADPMTGFIAERIDPAGALKASAAIQSVGSEGAEGKLSFVASPEETFPLIGCRQNEAGRLVQSAFLMNRAHRCFDLLERMGQPLRGTFPPPFQEWEPRED
jgi:hypothetical protein